MPLVCLARVDRSIDFATRTTPIPLADRRTMSAMAPERAPDDGFDAVLARLRKVVEHLEAGQLSLEDSLTAYEEGIALARRGHELLDGAEQRVELLVAGGSQSVPLDEAVTDEP
jgi:exodeoxyribonuclease VII small subunit